MVKLIRSFEHAAGVISGYFMAEESIQLKLPLNADDK
jgi:hypothetical protein